MFRKVGRLFSSEDSSSKNSKSTSSVNSSLSSSATTATAEVRGYKAAHSDKSGSDGQQQRSREQSEPLRFTSIDVQLHEDNAPTCACWSSKDSLATGGRDKYVSIYNINSQRVQTRFEAHQSALTRCCFATGLDRLFTAARDGSIRIWNGSTEVRTINSAHSLAITGLAASATQPHLMTGARDCCVKLWDIRTAQLIRSVSIAQNIVTWLSWPSQRCKQGELQSGDAVDNAPGDNSTPASTVDQSGSSLVVQSSEDKSVRIWDTRTVQAAIQFPRTAHIQTHADLHLGAQQCVSSSHGDSDGRVPVTVWDLRTTRPFAVLQGHRESVGWCSFVHDWPTAQVGVFVASASNDGVVRLWRTDRIADAGECVAQAQLATGYQTGACCALLTCVDSQACSMYVLTLQGGLFRLRYRGDNDAVSFF